MKPKKPTVEILISLQTEIFFSPVRFFFPYSEKYTPYPADNYSC